MSFTVYPAIDVRGGRVVRLRQGDYAQETRYADDPFVVALDYARQGARWLHLVDLDAARSGGWGLAELLRRISGETGLQVQSGGGVRTEADVERLLAAGVARVVIGSRAVVAPNDTIVWLQRYSAERITVALDARQDDSGQWMLPVHGWTAGSGRTLDELIEAYADSALRHVLCTDIARDGMLGGPNLQLYARLSARAPHWQVQASGGVRELDDIRAARSAGTAGVVLGRALLERRFSLAEALAC